MSSKWQRLELNHYSNEERIKDAKNIPGVYAIYAENRLIYVGCSSNVRSRLLSHGIIYDLEETERGFKYVVTTPWGNYMDLFAKVSYSDRLGDWLMREYRLIYRLRPSGNKRL